MQLLHSEKPCHQLFIRDKLTWLGYLLIGFYCSVISSLGPIMPFLRSELHLSYTIAALHFSAPATGSLLAGIIGDRVVSKLGRARTIWAGGSGVITGTVIALVGTNPICTIFGAWLIGFCGSHMCQTITALMSDRFKEERAIAITESNIAASTFCALAPLLVSATARLGLNWRFALLPSIMLFLTLACFNKNTVTGSLAGSKPLLTRSSLPPAYWAFFLVILLGVAGEWSIIFWSSDFLEKCIHLSKADAAAGVSVFLTAMFAGRIIGSRLTRSVPTSVLLPIAASIAAAGFLLFWRGQAPLWNLSGLLIAGLGAANMYPLSLAAAIGVAPEQSSRATVRMSISSGIAILSTPLILGLIADRHGIGEAYALVAILLLVAVAMVFVATTMAQKHHTMKTAGLLVGADISSADGAT